MQGGSVTFTVKLFLMGGDTTSLGVKSLKEDITAKDIAATPKNFSLFI
jgi:hypothetical protein